MENLVFTQLSVPEVRQLFRDELESYFASNQRINTQPEADEIGGIELAVNITGKAKPTIYNYCSGNLIPHSKRGKKLYFSRNELTEWLKSGKRKTQHELALEVENFSPNNSKHNNKIVTAR